MEALQQEPMIKVYRINGNQFGGDEKDRHFKDGFFVTDDPLDLTMTFRR
jgi:hypothetical protein